MKSNIVTIVGHGKTWRVSTARLDGTWTRSQGRVQDLKESRTDKYESPLTDSIFRLRA